MQNFVSIDFETANPCLDSICQIGLVEFENDQIKKEWNFYINPEDWFDPMNISIHGITQEMVNDKPTFSEIFPELSNIIKNKTVVHHTAFDRTAFYQACDKYSIDKNIPLIWLDTAKVVRRTWAQFQQRGYGLGPVSNFLNIEFKHHNAVEDAKAAGLILLAAKKESGITITEWLNKITKPITPRVRVAYDNVANIKRDGNSEGEFFGETIVFTGSFCLPKKDLSVIASEKGCDVDPGFTTRTTILVVGNQNPKALRGEIKSSKHRAAEKRIANGEDVKILSENDFISMFDINLS